MLTDLTNFCTTTARNDFVTKCSNLLIIINSIVQMMASKRQCLLTTFVK